MCFSFGPRSVFMSSWNWLCKWFVVPLGPSRQTHTQWGRNNEIMSSFNHLTFVFSTFHHSAIDFSSWYFRIFTILVSLFQLFTIVLSCFRCFGLGVYVEMALTGHRKMKSWHNKGFFQTICASPCNHCRCDLYLTFGFSFVL